MADLFVHLRMKDCCRKALESIDKKKKTAKFGKTQKGLLGKQLAPWLGNMTIPAAETALGNTPHLGPIELKSVAKAGGALAKGSYGKAAGMLMGEMGDLVNVVRITCKKVADKHAAEHVGKGETKEGSFWKKLGGAL